MRLRCTFNYCAAPIEPNDFIRDSVIDVVCSTEDGEPVVAGRVAVDHLDLTRAECSGQDIYEVCDADSAGWEQVYAGLLDTHSGMVNLKADLELNESVCHVLFIHKAFFHRSIREWQSYVIDHVCRLFGEDSIAVMWKGETDLSEKELADLGFRKVANENLIFRLNMYVHPYDATKDQRDPPVMDVDTDAEDFINEGWGDD